jgi:hypothetical protein
VLTYEVNLPEGKNKILYVDTEQSKAHCKKTLARILALANLSDGTDSDRLEFLSLRKYTPKERIEIIECALATTEGIGLVIIDGVRDLLFDINAPLEATQITSILMRWTDEYQIHIHTILHQNKGDENARGHIGTEINNKAETIIKVEKDKSNENISKVSAVLTRAQTFPTFAFRINDHILPELVEDYVPEPKKAGRPSKKEFDPYFDITQEQHEIALERIFPTMFDEFNYEDLQNKLVEELRTILGSFNKNKAAAEKFGLDKLVIVVRLHPNLIGKVNTQSLVSYDYVVDATNYHDMQELLCIADMLITDYSSSMFDFAMLRKPCILYATDVAQYDRGYYFNFKQLPFPLAETENELLSILKDFNEEKYLSALEKFYKETIGLYEDGHASESIACWMRNHRS